MAKWSNPQKNMANPEKKTEHANQATVTDMDRQCSTKTERDSRSPRRK